ncbi:hypothetical protein AB6A40_004275 [Gnathostoma spinigerum]|uniref:Uncharacterized protein n=1 Tax=Gnathostoma spinigerum TaxID=75299 RepID=A0ABD6EEC0_9BILA
MEVNCICALEYNVNNGSGIIKYHQNALRHQLWKERRKKKRSSQTEFITSDAVNATKFSGGQTVTAVEEKDTIYLAHADTFSLSNIPSTLHHFLGPVSIFFPAVYFNLQFLRFCVSISRV